MDKPDKPTLGEILQAAMQKKAEERKQLGLEPDHREPDALDDESVDEEHWSDYADVFGSAYWYE